MTNHIVIDEEFRNLIARLSDEEYAQLQENIMREGCRDPLVIWKETSILLDGHHRHQICAAHAQPFKTVSLPFPDRLHAKQWIVKNQLGRRNLSPDMIAYLRGKQYEIEKQIHGGDRKSKSQNETLMGDTAERLAEGHGVNRATIHRDAAFAKAVDMLGESAGEQAKQDILSGQAHMTRQQVQDLARQAPDKQQFVMAQRRNRIEAQAQAKEEMASPEEIEREARARKAVRDDPAIKLLEQYEVLSKLLYRVSAIYTKFEQDTKLDFSRWSKEEAEYAHFYLSECEQKAARFRRAIEQAHPHLKTRGLRQVK